MSSSKKPKRPRRPRYASHEEQLRELYDHHQKRDLQVADALSEIAHRLAETRGTGAVGAIAAVIDFMVRQYAPRRRRWS